MAKGKNKQQSKRGGGRGGRAEKHAFFKKKWYTLRSPPTIGNSVMVGWVPANKTIGTKLSKDGLMNRVAKVNLGDVQENTSFPWKTVKMQIEEVKSSACYTSFYGLGKKYNYFFIKSKKNRYDQRKAVHFP